MTKYKFCNCHCLYSRRGSYKTKKALLTPLVLPQRKCLKDGNKVKSLFGAKKTKRKFQKMNPEKFLEMINIISIQSIQGHHYQFQRTFDFNKESIKLYAHLMSLNFRRDGRCPQLKLADFHRSHLL